MIGFSFVAACRWQPRYDFGDAAGTAFDVPALEIYTDPLYIVELASTSFSLPAVALISVFVPLGTIGDDEAGTVFALPSPSIVSVIHPIGTVEASSAGTSFAVPTSSLIEVLTPIGTIADEDASTSFRIPVLSCAPP